MYPITRSLWKQCHAGVTHMPFARYTWRGPLPWLRQVRPVYFTTWNCKQRLLYMQEDPETAAVENLQICSMDSCL